MARRREFDEDEVIDKAMDAFWAHGYRSTTPQMLVDVTGLSKSSLYSTFGSKQGLFLVALDRYLEAQQQTISTLLDDATLRGSLQRLYTAMIGMATMGEASRCCLIASSTMEVPEDDVDATARVAAAMERMVDTFRARFERAIGDGELADDANADELARFVVNANMGLQVTGRVNPDPEVLWAIANQVIEAVV